MKTLEQHWQTYRMGHDDPTQVASWAELDTPSRRAFEALIQSIADDNASDRKASLEAWRTANAIAPEPEIKQRMRDFVNAEISDDSVRIHLHRAINQWSGPLGG